MAIKNKKEVERYYKTHFLSLREVGNHFGIKYPTIANWSQKGKWKKGELLSNNKPDVASAKTTSSSKNTLKVGRRKYVPICAGQISLERNTKETQIRIRCNVYGNGKTVVRSGVGFFDHMLETFGKHALIDIELVCKGDLQVDTHHSIEDCGIVIGKVLHQSIYPVSNIERFGNASVIMDETCVECDIDISNRPFLVFDTRSYGLPFKGNVGTLDVELVEEFFRALCFNASFSAHIVLKRGKNLHHIVEAMFKAFAVSLRRALTQNPRMLIPSTKGII